MRQLLRSRRRGSIVLWLLGLALFLPTVPDQGGHGTAAAQTTENSATTLSGQIELARLVDLCAERLRLHIDYDAASLKGAVTLRLADGLRDDELWALTNQLLASRGFTSINLGSKSGRPMMSIVKLAEAPGIAAVQDSPSATQAGFVNVVTRIQHQPVKSIVEAVKQLLSKPTGAITDLGTGNLVLISDLRSRADQALELIQRLDVPVRQPLVQRVPAQFVNGTQLAALVTAAVAARDTMVPAPLKGKLFAAPDADSIVLVCPPEEREAWEELIQRFDQRQPVTTQTYAPKNFGCQDIAKLIEQTDRDSGPHGSADQWKLVIDRLTGTLIVTATANEHERIAALIQRMDSMPGEARRPLRVFVIRNRSVRELVEVISKLLQAGVFDAEADRRQAAATQPPLAATRERSTTVRPSGLPELTPAPSIADNVSTGIGANSTVHGSAPKTEDTEPARKVLSRAGDQSSGDIPLTLTSDEGTNTLIAVADARLLGQLEELIAKLDVRQPQVMIEVVVVSLSEADTLDLGAELKKIEISGGTIISLSSLFGLGTSGSLDGGVGDAGRGFTGIVLNPGDFSVVIRALQTLNRGRTLSLPRVLVNNGQQATLDSVLQQPFVSVNASNTVATTSFGGSENAGTIITIKPQIAEGDHLVLEYSIALSAFVGQAADPTLPPPKQSNNLASVVTIPDGYTVVVGGLEITTDSRAISQVPLVGSIPIVGEAFKNRSNSQSKNRFYVFIHCDVLRHEGFEDLKYLSDRATQEAGIDDGWPTVEPRIIR